MMLFDCSHHAEFGGQGRETFLLGGDGKTFVHVGPFIVFAVCGRSEVFRGIADSVELFEPDLGVLLFVVRGFQEQRGDLLKAFLFGLGGEVGILVPGLGLAGKGGFQVLFGLGSGIGILLRRFRFHLYEFGSRLFAYRAGEALGQGTFVNITADRAFPGFHFGFLLYCFGFIE